MPGDGVVAGVIRYDCDESRAPAPHRHRGRRLIPVYANA